MGHPSNLPLRLIPYILLQLPEMLLSIETLTSHQAIREMGWDMVSTSEIEDLVETLSNRLPIRGWRQPKLENILPPLDLDIERLCIEKIDQNTPWPNSVGRGDINVQKERVYWEHRGQPKIMGLNALCICYLRRITPHRNHAWTLFSRIWDEQLEFMIERISRRFLMSTIATFSEMAETPERRLLAKLGFQYGAFIRLYESERLKEGRSLEVGDYKIFEKNVKFGEGDPGVYFAIDGAVENIHLYLMEEMHSDPLIGTLIAALIAQTRKSHTVFSRIDRERIRRGAAPHLEKHYWSFGKRPEGVEEPKLTDAEAG